jgi:APA family basic amino acid/polyamine antiporter
MPPPPPAALERRLGPLDAAAIVVSNVIGGGIFFVPPIVAQFVPGAAPALGVWLLGGLLALAGAMAYAELAALRPRAGAEYVYLREAYGPMAAFLTGWTSFVAGFSGAIAASAIGLAEYMGRFLPAAADPAPLLTLPLPGLALVVSRRSLVALAAIAALCLVHVRGLGPGRIVQNTLAGLKVSGLILFVALGLSVGHAGTAEPAAVSSASSAFSGVMLALIPVMFTYSGWNAAAYVAEEIKNPGRNVPIALALGTSVVIVIYLALNYLYLNTLGVAGLAATDVSLIDRVAERLFAANAGDIVGVFTVVSIAASISAMTLAGPRVYYAMAQDGLFPPAAARIHAKFRTPTVAIVAQAIWSGILVLSGTLVQLVSYTGFALVLFSGVAVAGLFVLRWRHPDAERPFSAWGYPVAPALFVVAAAAMLVNEIWGRPGPALAGTAIILAGLPVYFYYSQKRP